MSETVTTKAVNIAGTEIVNFRIVEKYAPRPPSNQSQYQAGQQSISPLARGIIEGTALQVANLNFSHVCDFRFVLNFNLGMVGIPDFIGLIAQAIKNAKLRAAAYVRTLVQRVVDAVRAVFDFIIKALTIDPTGEVSVYVSVGKDWLRKINYWAKKIAQFIEDVLVVVYIVKQIIELIQFILSLPDRIKALVRQCIANFLGSVKRLINQIVAIPNTIIGEYNRVVSEITGQIQGVTAQLESELNITGPESAVNSTVGYVNTGIQTEKELTANLKTSLTSSANNQFNGPVNKIILSTQSANSVTQLQAAGNTSVSTINSFVSTSVANATTSFANTSNNMTVNIPAPYDKANTANTLP